MNNHFPDLISIPELEDKHYDLMIGAINQGKVLQFPVGAIDQESVTLHIVERPNHHGLYDSFHGMTANEMKKKYDDVFELAAIELIDKTFSDNNGEMPKIMEQ